MGSPDEKDHAREAEDSEPNRARLRAALRAKMRKVKAIYPDYVENQILDLVAEECVALRKRVSMMLDLVRERYALDDVTDGRLERLAFVVLCHHSDGGLAVSLPEDVKEEE